MQLAVVALVASTLMQVKDCTVMRCMPGSLCAVEEGVARCFKGCKTTCGKHAHHGWRGLDDGSNACNKCVCNDGDMVCSEALCPAKPCSKQGICAASSMCGGVMGEACGGKVEVCLDDATDTCDPLAGDTDCAGCCVFDQCVTSRCSAGHKCQLNSMGQADCVKDDAGCCSLLPTCPTGLEKAESCTKGELRVGTCLEVSRCCQTIHCKPTGSLN
ncbi:hypothetical protein DIPPA_12110 [Diplonema papillatum]|nr:hypothetical protein DIPPA_12110 [Diplonema papillatum]